MTKKPKYKVGDQLIWTNRRSGREKELVVKRISHNGAGDVLYMEDYGPAGFQEINCRPASPTDRIEIFVGKDGKTTVALHKQGGKVINKAVAKCHPDDEFAFEAGANLAFERLMKNENNYEGFIRHQNDLIDKLILRNVGLHSKINKIKEIVND